jgi:hypothetical protein
MVLDSVVVRGSLTQGEMTLWMADGTVHILDPPGPQVEVRRNREETRETE